MAEYTCIVCPNSCRITVEEKNGELTFSGASCVRGEDFAAKEHTHPMRMFTSTVKLTGSPVRRLSVITSGEVAKECIPECQKTVMGLSVAAPVQYGDVIVKNICNQGVDLVAARSIDA